MGNKKTFDSERLKKIKKAFKRQGGIIDQSKDALRYLKERGVEGITFNSKTILLPKKPTTSAVFEELIHTAQYRTGHVDELTERFGNVMAELMMEIEAAEKLIRNAKAYGIPASETEQTMKRLGKLLQQPELQQTLGEQ